MEKFSITGIQIHSASVEELNNYILNVCNEHSKALILSGNIHSFNLASKNKWLKEYLNSADIVRCDGAGIVWGAKILGYSIKQRITWADYGWDLAKFCAGNNLSLFLLGNDKGIAGAAATRLKEKIPGLQIKDTHHGFFSKTGQESKNIVDTINKSGANILLLGLGMPLQEKWLKEHFSTINVNIVMTCGAAFQFLSGTTKRCPKWVGDLGFEWLYRFLLEPKRMFKRSIIGNWTFIFRVLKSKIFD